MHNSGQSIYSIDRQLLAKSRIQLHYAIQPLAATATALCQVEADSSHMALSWEDGIGFVTQSIVTSQPFRVALDPVSLTLSILNVDRQPISTFCLNGKTLPAAFDWVKIVVDGLGADPAKITPISYPPDDFPDSDLAHGASFELQENTNLSAYYASGNRILQSIVTQEPSASPVRIWPHHFDLATLISISGKKNGEPMSVGVGLSPGDRSYDEPYWYVAPYPYPEGDLPTLEEHGIWHAEHWVGAVLTASQFSEPNASTAQVKAFLDSSIDACKKLLRI